MIILHLYFDKTKVVGTAVCEATRMKCGNEMRGLVARIEEKIGFK